MSNETNPHAGHRQRMRERLYADPLLTGFSEHEILEMLLYYSVPRADTNETAHSLISKYGSLDAVLSTPMSELGKSGIVGESTARSLAFIGSVCGYLRRGLVRRYVSVNSLNDVKDHIYSAFRDERRELLLIYGVNQNKNIVFTKVLASGNDRMVLYDHDALLREIMSAGFKDIILAHNHPFAGSAPSQQDIEATDRLIISLKDLNITLLDHLIAGDTDVYSFRENGRLFDLF